MGRGGTNLQELETRTATQSSIPKANENDDKITISGPKDGIEKAMHEIQLISDVQSKQVLFILGRCQHDSKNSVKSKVMTGFIDILNSYQLLGL